LRTIIVFLFFNLVVAGRAASELGTRLFSPFLSTLYEAANPVRAALPPVYAKQGQNEDEADACG
jgi:hypothetical protein